MLEVYGASDTGRVRAVNEDRFLIGSTLGRGLIVPNTSWDAEYVDQYGLLCAVADGMGGQRGGAEASRIVLETLADRELGLSAQKDPASARAFLERAIADAHAAIGETGRLTPQLADMGSTLAGVYIRADFVLGFHAGDSRIYRLRSGALSQLTSDHSLESLVAGAADGELRPKSGVITNSVGGGAGAKCEPEFAEFSLYEDDWLLLCTDGLTDMLSLDELESIMNAPGDMPLKAKALVDAANRAGGVDNITVVLVHRR